MGHFLVYWFLYLLTPFKTEQQCLICRTMKLMHQRNEGPWNIVHHKKISSSPKKPRKGILRGQKKVKSWTLFVNNIEVEPDFDEKEVLYNVRHHCSNAGVKVIHTELIPNKRRDDIVGCKLTVPKAMAATVKEQGFWPPFVRCRDWSSNKVGNQYKGPKLWDIVRERNANFNNRKSEDHNSRARQDPYYHYDNREWYGSRSSNDRNQDDRHHDRHDGNNRQRW